MNQLETFRHSVLASFGAKNGEQAELLEYNRNHFNLENVNSHHFPIADEPFVAAWDGYARDVREAGTVAALAKYLVQLQFPVREGISQSAEYLASTRQGAAPLVNESDAPVWEAPHSCRVVVHQTAAGRIPLIIAEQRDDFVYLVRALTRRNEPAAIPASMGACMVAGYNNWHRIGRLRDEFLATAPPGSSWSEEFQRVRTQPDLYQDRFIILSSGPYSGVKAAELGLDESTWLSLSLDIRREHECAHYFARRVFSSMRNNLLDELIADYFGISAATGRFRADWLLRFMGLESFPTYREGGRLQNYRGKPPLSQDAFVVLQRLVRAAAINLEAFDREHVPEWTHLALEPAIYSALATLTLEEMGAETGAEILVNRFRKFQTLLSRASGMTGTDVGAQEDLHNRTRGTEAATADFAR